MNEKECTIHGHADEAYTAVVNKYMENWEPDRDIDIIANKFDDIILDTCPDYIMSDDLAEQLLMGNLNDLTDFAYYMEYLGIEPKLIDLIEEPRKYCNFYITELVWYRLGDILDRLENRIGDFENKCMEMPPDSREVESEYRKMVTDTLLNHMEESQPYGLTTGSAGGLDEPLRGIFRCRL